MIHDPLLVECCSLPRPQPGVHSSGPLSLDYQRHTALRTFSYLPPSNPKLYANLQFLLLPLWPEGKGCNVCVSTASLL